MSVSYMEVSRLVQYRDDSIHLSTGEFKPVCSEVQEAPDPKTWVEAWPLNSELALEDVKLTCDVCKQVGERMLEEIDNALDSAEGSGDE